MQQDAIIKRYKLGINIGGFNDDIIKHVRDSINVINIFWRE